MSREQRYNKPKRIRSIVCVLNWGLGHATRSMPIIQSLLDLNHEVVIASDGESLDLLRKEYPQQEYLVLPSYAVSYGSFLSFQWAIFWQIPKFLRMIKKEQKVLFNYLQENPVDQLISDNRWGCYSANCPSVFLTHQLFLKLGPRKKYIEKLLAKFQAKLLQRFTHCWVPDYKGEENLSGELSHSKEASPYKIPITYIGPLSRFSLSSVNESLENHSGEKSPKDLLFLLSGPEPARSVFERLIIKQLFGSELKSVLVRGTTQGESIAKLPTGLEVHDLLSVKELYPLILQAKMIVCRSGYSSIMDLICLKKQSILVPTPGQTEQEYLADHLLDNFLFSSVRQERFNLLEQGSKKIDGNQRVSVLAGEMKLSNKLLGKAIAELCTV